MLEEEIEEAPIWSSGMIVNQDSDVVNFIISFLADLDVLIKS